MRDHELELLIDCGLVEPAGEGGGGYAARRLVLPLQPDQVDALAALVDERLPDELGAIAITDSPLDAQLGYVLARARDLPLCLLYDHEGIGYLDGSVPSAGPLSLVTGVLLSEWLLREFEGLCRQREIRLGPVVALVDWLDREAGLPVESVVSRRELSEAGNPAAG